MTGEGGVVLGGGGAVITPTDLNEGPGDDRVVLGRGAAMAPMPIVDVEPPPRDVFVNDCASAAIVDETTASVAATRGIQ